MKITASITTKFHTTIFLVGPNKSQTNPRWWTAAILKNWRITISQKLFDRFQ